MKQNALSARCSGQGRLQPGDSEKKPLDPFAAFINSSKDLVILDMIMPSMGGKEVFVALKGIDPTVKAILSSGYAMNDQAREIMALGILAFVQKPYAVEELAKRLREVLGPLARPL